MKLNVSETADVVDVQESHWPARLWSKSYYSTHWYFTGRTATANIGGRLYDVGEYEYGGFKVWVNRQRQFVKEPK